MANWLMLMMKNNQKQINTLVLSAISSRHKQIESDIKTSNKSIN